MKKSSKEKKTTSKGSGADASQESRRVKLREHTAFKKSGKEEEKGRVPVWVKESTLDYERQLHDLQIELMKMQSRVRADGLRIVMLFEGRDAAGKGGTIKRFTEHMNPRGARVVALEIPSDKERTQWYFQRYVANLPTAGEIVFFDRSWYNRAMVEPVMGFCTDQENKRFLKDVPLFERMLVKDGIKLFKFYFSVSKKEQLRRFRSRHGDLLRQYKISPVDELAQELWDQYTVKKFQMLSETNRTIAPWTIVRSDVKKLARLNCIKFVLSQIDYSDKAPAELLDDRPRHHHLRHRRAQDDGGQLDEAQVPSGLVRFDDSDVGQRPIPLSPIEPKANHPHVGNLESQIVDLGVDLAPIGLVDQHTGFERGRLAGREIAQQIAQGVAGVDDVLHHQDMPFGDTAPQVHDHPDGAGGFGGIGVGRQGHEVYGARDGELPREIGQENERPLEDADHQEVVDAGVVLGDLTGKLGDLFLDGLGADQDPGFAHCDASRGHVSTTRNMRR